MDYAATSGDASAPSSTDHRARSASRPAPSVLPVPASTRTAREHRVARVAAWTKHPRADPRLPGRPAHRGRRRRRAGLPAGRRRRRRLDRRHGGPGRGGRRDGPSPASRTRARARRCATGFRYALEHGAAGRRHARRRRPARPGGDPALPRGVRGVAAGARSSAGATSARCRPSGGCRTRSAAGCSRLPSGGTSRTTSRAIGSSAGS